MTAPTSHGSALVLGIETSCDETAAAVVRGRDVLSNVVATQIPVHARYGGVVPELASRNHLMALLPVIDRALALAGIGMTDLDALAVTQGPGLMGGLLVGVQTAKTIALLHSLPLIGVDHIEAHITAAGLRPAGQAADACVEPPYVALVASGGHTALYAVRGLGDMTVLGHTLDDAAGEAFDKSAKILGLPYPGGAAIDALAEEGMTDAVEFPRAWMGKSSLDFSFSGLKTAVRQHVQNRPPEELTRAEVARIAAGMRESVADVLTKKALRAVRAAKMNTLVLAGGVAANRRLRSLASERCRGAQVRLVCTPLPYCTDNAAMVAGLAVRRLEAWEATGHAAPYPDVVPYPNLRAGSPRAARRKAKYNEPLSPSSSGGTP